MAEVQNDPGGSSSLPKRVDLLRIHLATLHQPGLGLQLARRFGSLRAIVSERVDVLLKSVEGLRPSTLDRLSSRALERRAEEELRHVEREGLRIVSVGDVDYPSAFEFLPDMPLLFFARGQWPAGGTVDAERVAIVGARRPSRYGLSQARRFSQELASRGVTIVSGLARGVDAEAHRGALAGGGKTLAVLGSGLGRVYPAEHRRLSEEIGCRGGGCLVSEFPFLTPPRSFHFPLRNRLISAFSACVLVIEAGARSGSLITVRHALEQGCTVCVLPGRVDRAEAEGGLQLLRDGAVPALEPADILIEIRGLGALRDCGRAVSEPRAENASPSGSSLEIHLERLFLEEDVWHADGIAARLRLETAEVLSELTRLEMEGRIDRVPGGGYALRSAFR